MKKILVPIDGSDSAKRALDRAKKIAECMGSEITILNVITPITSFRTMSDQEAIQEAENINQYNSKKLLRTALDSLNDFTGKVDTKTRIGNTTEEIINEAEGGGYDAVIMGSRGQGVFSRTLLGSVSDKVVHHAKISVFIVK